MKKETTPPAGGDDTAASIETPVEITDEAAKEGASQFDRKHEWPTKGGCYVRQPDGTLKSEG
jgi:hypothetical protein